MNGGHEVEGTEAGSMNGGNEVGSSSEDSSSDKYSDDFHDEDEPMDFDGVEGEDEGRGDVKMGGSESVGKVDYGNGAGPGAEGKEPFSTVTKAEKVKEGKPANEDIDLDVEWKPVPFIPGHWTVLVGSDLERWTRQLTSSLPFSSDAGASESATAPLIRQAPPLARYNLSSSKDDITS